MLIDPHAPGKWRVNGPLSNMPQFAAAFKCQPGDPMVRPADQRAENLVRSRGGGLVVGGWWLVAGGWWLVVGGPVVGAW